MKVLFIASLILLASCQKESNEAVTMRGNLVKDGQPVGIHFREEDKYLADRIDVGDTIIASRSSGDSYMYRPDVSYTTDTSVYETHDISFWQSYSQVIISNK